MNQYRVPAHPDLNDDLFVITGTIWGEIRGGTLEAKQNVAQVIHNRYLQAKHSHPNITYREICLAPYQFSCWNENDPNRDKILNDSRKYTTKAWEYCAQVAQEMMAGNNPNRIKEACNYYSCAMQTPPAWADPPSIVTYADHFFRFVYIPPHS